MLLANGVAVVFAVLTLLVAHRLYLARAELRLEPVHTGRFAAENARLPPATHARVVLFGDSRIVGWAPMFAAEELEVVARGVGGESTSQMVHRFEGDALALRPTTVVIEAGINDLVAGAALGRLEEAQRLVVHNLRSMADAAQRARVNVVLLTVIRPSKPEIYRKLWWDDAIYDAVTKVNVELQRSSGGRVRVLDADALLSHGAMRLPDEFARDSLHLSADAYGVLNAELIPLLTIDAHAVQ